MIDFIAQLISGDGITKVLMITGIYLVLIWFLFSFWVFLDAKKRYRKTITAVIFFFVVLIFSFPALIFYLITRPEEDGEFVLFPAEHLGNRGVNIPVVNFIGKDGKVNLSFELRINSDVVGEDMSINVDWKSEDKNFKKEEVKINTKESSKKDSKDKSEEKVSSLKENTTKSIAHVKNKVSKFKNKFNLPNKNTKKDKKK